MNANKLQKYGFFLLHKAINGKFSAKTSRYPNGIFLMTL